MIKPVVISCSFLIVSEPSDSRSLLEEIRKMSNTLAIIPIKDIVYFMLKDLRILRRLHLQKNAEMGSARAFVAIDIDGSTMLRPKMKSKFCVKSHNAGYINYTNLISLLWTESSLNTV